ncbi:MAG: winged helix-turn-helix transcriptional regulator [Acidobacteria bacterium]|nr:winged helix-turn-helix transcriptional regulator [Acidobacteriota bacterium]
MEGLGCVPALRALGEGTRLRIMRILLERPMSVNDLAGELGTAQYNVSKHLRVMREAGLLEIEKQGQQRLYAVAKSLRGKAAAKNGVLDLGCCTFQVDKLPQ